MGNGKVVSTAVLAAAVLLVLFGGESFRLLPKGDQPGLLNIKFGTQSDKVAEEFNDYEKRFEKGGDVKMVDDYYTLATEFYEYGWGQSFHFAHTRADEELTAAIARHEHRIADEIKLKKGMHGLDVGCGVGGPMREIVRYTQAQVTGLTINQFQVDRGNNHTQKAGLSHLARSVRGDFTKMPYGENTFDAAYAIEATCHAPELTDVYGEVFRVLKPGSYFASYEWVTTDNYDAKNPVHAKSARNIEYGDGLPPLRSYKDAIAAAAKVGFKVIKTEDLAQDKKNTRPWYERMDISWASYYATHYFVTVLEFIGWAPKGTVDVHKILMTAADGLVTGGKLETFTPMYLIVMQKPAATA